MIRWNGGVVNGATDPEHRSEVKVTLRLWVMDLLPGRLKHHDTRHARLESSRWQSSPIESGITIATTRGGASAQTYSGK